MTVVRHDPMRGCWTEPIDEVIRAMSEVEGSLSLRCSYDYDCLIVMPSLTTYMIDISFILTT